MEQLELFPDDAVATTGLPTAWRRKFGPAPVADDTTANSGGDTTESGDGAETLEEAA